MRKTALRKEPKKSGKGGNGGAEGNRTPDLLIANEALSQLSYGPAFSESGGIMGVGEAPVKAA
jgi:hypothetical protein